MYKQNGSCLVKHSELGSKNLNKICPKIVQKVLKWPLHYVNFQNFFRGACTRTPLESFSFSIYFKTIRREKLRLNIYVQIWCPLPKNVSGYAANMKTFFKGLIYAQLVNILLKLKFHPLLPKFLGSAPCFYYHICKFYRFFEGFVTLFFNQYLISRLFRCHQQRNERF